MSERSASRCLGLWSAVGLAVAACGGCVRLPLAPEGAWTPPETIPYNTETLLARIPPLRHERGERWPLLLYEVPRAGPEDRCYEQGEPMPAEAYRELLRRGLVLPVRLDPKFIPMALAMQEAGCPVIFFAGNHGASEYTRAPDWEHHLNADYPLAGGPAKHPCPWRMDGWKLHADSLREILKRFSGAGVDARAFWLDWEDAPDYWPYEQYRQAAHCARCRKELPLSARWSFLGYMDYVQRLRLRIYSDYLARPILDVYPGASVANYEVCCSFKSPRTENYFGERFAPFDLGSFSDSMPCVYGATCIWTNYWRGVLTAPYHHWRHRRLMTAGPDVTDKVYTHVMLRVFSMEAAARQALAPGKGCVAWVARWAVEHGDHGKKVPMLSRGRYREILRHLWLRGADAMCIYTTPSHGSPTWTIYEIEDVAGVYDEMLEWREFLDGGQVMNLAVPGRTDDGPVWSGLRLGDRAIVRAFTQSPKPVSVRLRPWPGAKSVSLDAPPAGATYQLERTPVGVRVERRQPAMGEAGSSRLADPFTRSSPAL